MRRLLSVVEFPIPTPNSQPEAITAGPDGNIWFTEESALANKIGEINPTTHAVNEYSIPTPNSGVADITAGPDGNLWFTEPSTNKIGEINPTTHVITEFTIPTPESGPMGITAGPDGNLWFTEYYAPGNKIGEINPTTHAISEFQVPTADSQPDSITTGPDGNLWFTEASGGEHIGEINPTTHAISEFPTSDDGLFDITAGPDGNLWFTEGAAGQNIGEINPTTHAISEFPIPTLNSAPYGITAGSDGNLWFTEEAGNQIGEINPTTHAISEVQVPTPNSGPWDITTDQSGKIWFTETHGNQIGEITSTGASTITASSGSGQSATVNANLGSPLVVTVDDQSGNPVQNVAVTFAAPTTGASGAFSNGSTTITGFTDADGQVSEDFTANNEAGTYSVTASVEGISSPTSFSLTNNAGTPATLTATSGTDQRAGFNTAFANPLVLTVADQSGNPVPNVAVTFTAPTTGAGGTFSNGSASITDLTEANGQVSEDFTANSVMGTYSVTASVAGISTPTSFNLNNSPLITLSTFNGTNGSGPSGVVEDSEGNLFGTTSGGGTYNDGEVFEWVKSTGTISTLANFNGTDGSRPDGGVIEDNEGNLFGTTSGGGTYGDGTVFEWVKSTGTISVLASLDSATGKYPFAGVVEDTSGNLFGTANQGGTSSLEVNVTNPGTGYTAPPTVIFNNGGSSDATATATLDVGEVKVTNPGAGYTSAPTVTFSDGGGGGGATGTAIIDNGEVTGITVTSPGTGYTSPPTVTLSGGGGTAATAMAIVNNGEVVGFTVTNPGTGYTSTPIVTLSGGATATAIIDNGEVTGITITSPGTGYTSPLTMTLSGGGGAGATATAILAVGKVTVTNPGTNYTSAPTVTFTGGGGTGATASTTLEPGAGTVFEWVKSTGTISVVANFNVNNGASPEGGLTEDNNGNLFGTTAGAVYSNSVTYGEVFEWVKNTGVISVLARFNGTNGSYPGGITQDGSGDLFGTTSGGGSNNDGTLFEVGAGSKTLTTLASFNGTNGSAPYGVIEDNGGNLIGTTSEGGSNNDGTVFEWVKNNGTISDLASLDGTFGEYPGGVVIEDSNGNLFGTTGIGGTGSNHSDGTVFEIVKSLIVPTTLSWDASQGGVDLAYQVSRSPVLTDTQLALYWSRSNQFSDVIGSPIFTEDIPAGTEIGTYGPTIIPWSVLGIPPQGATNLLAVTDPKNVLGNFSANTNVISLEDQFNVSLASSDFTYPPNSIKNVDIDVQLQAFNATFNVTAPGTADQGAISSATGNASIDGGSPVPGRFIYVNPVSLTGSAIAYADVNVTVTLFQTAPTSVALGNPPPPDNVLGTIETGAHNVWLNTHNSSDEVLEWYTPGFTIYLPYYNTSVPIGTTGPLEDWVDISNSAGLPFTTIVQQAEQKIEATNSVIVFQKEILDSTWFKILSIFDPGQTSMLVTDPSGNQTGSTASGAIVANIPGSVYDPSVPLVIIVAPSSGQYGTELRGLATGSYQLVTAILNANQTLAQQSYTGSIAVGQALNYSLNVNSTSGTLTLGQVSTGSPSGTGPIPSAAPPPTLIQALESVYFDGIELALDALLGKDNTAALTSLAAYLPYTGPFGIIFEFAGIETVLDAINSGNTT